MTATSRPSRSLARNGALNVAGFAVSALVALVAIPVLIRGLGPERFGLLGLVWAALGYFNVFNLGIGRAVTQLAAALPDRGRSRQLTALTDSALIILATSGAVGGIALAAAATWLLPAVIDQPALWAEARASFYLVAVAIPFVVGTAAFVGLLEGLHRFGVVNAIRIPGSILSFAGPLAVIPFTSTLVPVVALLVGVRVATWAAYGAVYLREMRVGGAGFRLDREWARRLLRFGGWMTVVNGVVSLMDYVDRFLIGALLSLAAVAFYVTPQEMVMRVAPLPAALTAVLFPAFAAARSRDAGAARALYLRGVKALLAVIFPIALVLVTFSGEIIHLWLGEELAARSATVLAWLAVGLMLSAAGQGVSAYIQASGRPELLAALLLLEAPLYLGALYLLTSRFGIEGAAIAWVLRVVLDLVGGLLISERALRTEGVLRNLLPVATLAVLAAAAPSLAEGSLPRFILLLLIASGFAVVGWRWLLEPADRQRITIAWARMWAGGAVP